VSLGGLKHLGNDGVLIPVIRIRLAPISIVVLGKVIMV
jgi:hypothetical protein